MLRNVGGPPHPAGSRVTVDPRPPGAPPPPAPPRSPARSHTAPHHRLATTERNRARLRFPPGRGRAPAPSPLEEAPTVLFSTNPGPQGLYDPAYEHDACGVGAVADTQGRRSHRIVSDALQVLHH